MGSGSIPPPAPEHVKLTPCAYIIQDMNSDRGAWPVRKFRLGSEPSDDLSTLTTAEERLEMMWPLTLEAWALAGKPLPEYRREATPILLHQRPVS